MAVVFKTLTGTIPANVNEITFTDSMINSNTIVESYYNNNNVYTLETWQEGTTIGIVTSDHDFPVGIKITLNNVTSFEPYDDSEIVQDISDIEEAVSGLATRVGNAEDDIDGLATRVGNAEDDIDALENNKQDTLTAGDNITIENNVISANGGGGWGTPSLIEQAALKTVGDEMSIDFNGFVVIFVSPTTSQNEVYLTVEKKNTNYAYGACWYHSGYYSSIVIPVMNGDILRVVSSLNVSFVNVSKYPFA